jgi:hypothetical protein
MVKTLFTIKVKVKVKFVITEVHGQSIAYYQGKNYRKFKVKQSLRTNVKVKVKFVITGISRSNHCYRSK